MGGYRIAPFGFASCKQAFRIAHAKFKQLGVAKPSRSAVIKQVVALLVKMHHPRTSDEVTKLYEDLCLKKSNSDASAAAASAATVAEDVKADDNQSTSESSASSTSPFTTSPTSPTSDQPEVPSWRMGLHNVGGVVFELLAPEVALRSWEYPCSSIMRDRRSVTAEEPTRPGVPVHKLEANHLHAQFMADAKLSAFIASVVAVRAEASHAVAVHLARACVRQIVKAVPLSALLGDIFGAEFATASVATPPNSEASSSSETASAQKTSEAMVFTASSAVPASAAAAATVACAPVSATNAPRQEQSFMNLIQVLAGSGVSLNALGFTLAKAICSESIATNNARRQRSAEVKAYRKALEAEFKQNALDTMARTQEQFAKGPETVVRMCGCPQPTLFQA